MEYVISPLWVFIELVSVYLFSSSFLSKRIAHKQTLVTFLVVWIVNSLTAMFIYSTPLRQLITLSTTFAVVFLCFRGSILRHIICVFLAIIFIGVADMACAYAACALLKINHDKLVLRKLSYVLVFTISKLIALFSAYLFHRFRRKKEIQKIHGRWLILTILFPALSFLMIFAFFATFKSSSDISIGSFGFIMIIATANAAVLYLIEIMEKRAKDEQQLILLNQQMRVQTNSIHALERSYRNQREASHEFMHHLQTISDLLNSGSTTKAQDYIQKIQGLQTTRIFVVNSHHAILDAVFNQMYHTACEQNTEVIFKVNDLSSLKIETNELVVIFSNLLDNALEACKMVSQNRQIICSALLEENFYISIRNTSPSVTITDGTITTSKSQKLEHGYGLPNVCRILEHLRAEYAFDYCEGWFQFVAEIPIENMP